MTRRKDGLYQEVLTVNEKKKYFYGKTKAEVLRKIRAYQEKEETGPLFKDVAEAWWEEHTPSLSPNTLRCYQKPYERAKEYFTKSYIKDITPKNVLIWLETLDQKQFSHKTLISHKLVIGLIFHYAILNGYINSNPSEYVTVPKGKPKVPRVLPLDGDIIKIQQSVHLPMGLLHYFILYTGCRRSEAMALKFSDIDENVVHITKSIYYDGPTPKIKQPKTAAGTRDIILLDVLKEKKVQESAI